MDDDQKKIAAVAGGAIFICLTISYLMGWLPTGNGNTFNKADGTVLACYTEFAGIDTERIRKIDWIEFRGTVEGRLKPLLADDTFEVDETTTKAAELLIEIAATHPLKEKEKVKQFAQDLEPLIEKIRG